MDRPPTPKSPRPPTPKSPRRPLPAIEIPLKSNVSSDKAPSLPSSPTAASADTLMQLPFVTPCCSLALQSKRVWNVRNALVASKMATCSIETLTQTVDARAAGDSASMLEKDGFVDLVRSLPELRTGATFKPMEESLERIFRSFEATNRTDIYQLATGCLVLLPGEIKRKVEVAMQFSLCGCGVDGSSPITLSIARTALGCLLLSVSAVFDLETATEDQLQSTASIVTTCVDETVARMFAANSLAKDATASFEEHIWPWIESNSSANKSVPWIKLLDQKKWPGSKKLTASTPPGTPTKWGLPDGPPTSSERGDDNDYEDEEDPAELSFRFSSVDGGLLTIGEQQAIDLYDLLVQSAFTRVNPQAMYDTFVQHTGDGLLEEETFLEAIEELLSMTDKPHLMENNTFLESMLAIFRSFLPEKCPTVDAFEIAAGFSLMSWGSKSDKLASAFHYFDADSKGYLNRQQLWRFLRSVLITLLHLSPPAEVVLHRYGSLAELVDKGEEEILEAIMEGLPSEAEYDDEDEDEDDDNEEKADADSEDGDNYVDEIDGDRARVNSDMRLGLYTFEDFGLWYNGGGFKGMSWLELLDLRKWVFVSPAFNLEGLDTRSVDPVVASNNYYTANNIQVDIDAVDPPDGVPGVKKPYFTFADVIDEEDDDDAAVSTREHPIPLSASIESSSTAVRSYNSSIPATLPAICLKNEIVLEFDLPFDADDDAITELPITTLSFDNGDLIQYFELQRVIKLNQVQLYRVYDVFEPFMEDPASSCIEKSTFDKCVGKLLPANVAPSVAAAFGANSNTRIPPRSVGRGKDPKMVADTLSRLFFAFNRGGTGKIDLVEFVSAFTIFCAGSKSEKLAFAYRLFDADGDGCLTRREMWKYLRSFLTMLLALGNGSELSAEAIASVADTTAIEIADCIFKDTDKTFSTRQSITSMQGSQRHSLDLPLSADTASFRSSSRHHRSGRYEHRGSFPGDGNLQLVGAASHASGVGAGSAFIRGGVVSFEEFAVWYSQHGYTIIAWIELLDTKKWPEVPRSVSDAILRYISRQQHALENATQMRSEETGSGSSNDTVSSNESSHRVHESLQPNFPDSDMTVLDTTAFRTVDRYAVEAGMDAVSGISNLITSPSASAAGSKDLSSVALQFKLTSYDNTALRIRLKDVAIVYTISERMNFSRMTTGELVHLLKKHAHNRTLTKPGYLRAMRDLVPRDELSNEDQEFLSFHLLRIFTLFESESVIQNNESNGDDGDENGFRVGMNTIAVETLQLVAGMCVFCGTTKSAKLGVLFKLFASHGDGHVSRRRLFEMLKSILVVLFAFSSYNATRGNSNDTGSVHSWSTNSIAERAAGAVVSKLFCEATCKRPDAINLAEFAAWYAAGGYMDCPWLELLDLSKWPAKEAFEASKREKPLIYAFDMLEEGSILHFTESDISTYLFMLRSTKLGELSVSKVYDALLAYATPSAEEALKMSKAVGTQSRRGQMYSYAAVEEDEGAYLVLTRTNFYECVRSLVSKDGMSEKAQQTSSKLLSRLFNVFDRKRCGRVNALELACGLSILGRGSKSQKLSLAFDFITKMRQQRHKTLASYAPPPPSTAMGFGGFGAQGTATGGFGFGLGGVQSNQFSMSGGFGFPSTRGFGSTAQGMRSVTNRQAPPLSVAEINALPHSVLFIYLRSFLLALMALSDGTYRLGLEKIYVEADDFIEEAMGDLMTDVTANGGANIPATNGLSGYGSARSRARVTFEQFGEWYNTGGYQLISWVELLDVSKWQQQQDFQDQTMSAAGPASTYQSKRTSPVMGSQSRGPMSTAAPMPVEPMQPIQQTVKPVTRRRQVRQSDIVSTPFVHGLPTADQDTKQDPRESTGALSLSSDGPVMVFAVATEAAELQFFNEDISTLKLFLRQTQLHTVTSWELQGAVLEALDFPTANTAGIMLTRRSTFLRALQKVCGTLPLVVPSSGSKDQTGFLSEEGVDMLHRILGVFVREPASDDEEEQIPADDGDDEAEDPVDIGAAICGMLVVCEGTLLEKLKCCTALISDDDGESAMKGEGEGEEETDGPMVKLETIKSSLMCFLMAFYGMSSSLSAEVARYSAELGADAVLQSFVEVDAPDLDLGKAVALHEFTDWFSDAGYPSHPWLELVVLNHWPAAINVCGSNGITDEGE
ncbi:Guanylyl cyclase inhibitory protein [Phytophthora nicotianae]|uniref:Guanylyl cyclase inhibitory protein n=1 Tax=Phytophthora nicotianae TaxID=4792 RepID=A0A0W8CFU9_PHYNI|nr:Guanylyl cyclase inhibitory protein [Phytophthora nicotianae]